MRRAVAHRAPRADLFASRHEYAIVMFTVPLYALILVVMAAGCTRHRSEGPPDSTGSGGWLFSYVSDCNGNDYDQSVGSANPSADRCAERSQAGNIAVCWDQVTYTNPAMPGPWCTYKQLNGQTCNGGSAAGRVSICAQP